MGVVDVLTGRPINLFITNFSATHVEVPQGMLVAQGAGLPGYLMDTHEGPPTCNAIFNRVHYKPSVRRETQIAIAQTVTQDDEEKMKCHSQDQLSLLEEFKYYRTRTLEIM